MCIIYYIQTYTFLFLKTGVYTQMDNYETYEKYVTQVDTIVYVKATGALQEEIEQELEQEEPDKEHAIASLKDKEE